MNQSKFPGSQLSFSQAEGIVPLPQPLELGKLPRQVRVRIWDALHESLNKSMRETPDIFRQIKGSWKEILFDYHTEFLHRSAEEFEYDFNSHVYDVRKLVLNKRFNTVFDFIQFVLRHHRCPIGLMESVRSSLLKFNCAYTIVAEGPTIVPVSSAEQGKAIQENFDALAADPFLGARMHLKRAAEYINASKPAASIRESIHSVESVARRIDSNAKTSLKPALDSLQRQGMYIHPAFQVALMKMYGYTSDEDGIRHSTIEESNVDMDDAVFIYGACASFSAYLIAKGRAKGLLQV